MNALLPDLLEIEELDFAPYIPCEHRQHELGLYGHEGPAYYLIKADFPCGHPAGVEFFYICKGGYEDPSPVECAECGSRYSVPNVWKIVAKVGS